MPRIAEHGSIWVSGDGFCHCWSMIADVSN
jgi:hypothetical protein